MANKKLHRILSLVEQRFAQGKRQSWKNKDFENLSFEILKKTKVLISVATLKRLFGKVKIAENYTPQEGTINALKEYVDFTEEVRSKYSKYNKKWILGGGIAASLVLITISLFLFNPKKTEITAVKCHLEILEVEGNCPATAYFKIQRNETEDPININFGDHSFLRLNPYQDRLSHFYAYPGLFKTYLTSRGQGCSDTNEVFVSTHDWIALGAYVEDELRERYYPIPIKSNSKNGLFHASPKKISTLGLDTSEIVSVTLSNFRKTQFNGDQFHYQTRFINDTFWPAIRCYSVRFNIQCEQGKIDFKLVGEGCSTYSQVNIGEKNFMGEDLGLSSLVIDRYQWQNVEVYNHQKQVLLLINGQEIFKNTYEKTLGNILGVNLEFHGAGTVDYIRLKQDSTLIFKHEFN